MTGSWQLLSEAAAGGGERPLLADPPRRRTQKGTELVRLRLPDRPGGLAAVTAHLARFGVDVLRLEIVDRSAGMAIDDILLAGPTLDEALAGIGDVATVLARRPGAELHDPGLAMATACGDVASARSEREAHRLLVQAATSLVFAEGAFLCARRTEGVLAVLASTVPDLPAAVDGSGASLITSAVFSGECLTADGRIPWAPRTLRDLLPSGSVAVVPGAAPESLVLALVREDHAPFVAGELDRLVALIRVASEAIRLHKTTFITSRIRVQSEGVAQ